jgi:hypothetical protein
MFYKDIGLHFLSRSWRIQWVCLLFLLTLWNLFFVLFDADVRVVKFSGLRLFFLRFPVLLYSLVLYCYGECYGCVNDLAE